MDDCSFLLNMIIFVLKYYCNNSKLCLMVELLNSVILWLKIEKNYDRRLVTEIIQWALAIYKGCPQNLADCKNHE